MGKTMRAVVLTGHGGLDKLEYREDVQVPSIGRDDVLIKVGACSLNNTDLNTRTGWYSPSVRGGMTAELGEKGVTDAVDDLANWDRSSLGFPRIQGAAIAGRIVAVGDGVSQERIGARVFVDPVVRDLTKPYREEGIKFIGSECDGGYAEFASVPSANAIEVRSDLTYVELSSFPCAFTTAEEMLERGRVSSGHMVLVTGAAGGVGSAAVQLAKRRGATVIAVAGETKREKLFELGADHFIARESGRLAEQVYELVGERTVDVVADVVGGENTVELLRVLKRGGRFTTGGAIAGAMVEIDLRDLIYKDLEMYGIANPVAQTMLNLARYIEAGEIKPLVEKTFPLRSLREAQVEFMKKTHVGKVVIDIDADA
ncbi:MAG: alcohol dehydrogenase [Paraburkholderia sp.]|uniref:NADPH:quinone reductase n=1 Tax=Paraburkholderia terricola TaxID=169427 RepID=A0A1M6T1U4_9BURK|nr:MULTISPECIES: zinc-binding dehydrogenase [Paraburkholderia]TAL95194.1 MAG: alcohol dehydrogenase [Paraburkholderia sp.]SDO70984.1 NADPH:quinone reductase [Paraburkholderia sediminicola]SHK50876.1 NADPH:quinone reductase [Paraburkholderia terricola]